MVLKCNIDLNFEGQRIRIFFKETFDPLESFLEHSCKFFRRFYNP